MERRFEVRVSVSRVPSRPYTKVLKSETMNMYNLVREIDCN